MKSLLPTIVLSLAAASAPISLAQDAPMTRMGVIKTFKIGGPGRWDYAMVDAPTHRLFLTRSTHTQAVDTETGKVVLDISGQKRSHCTALDDKLGRGFISDGGAGDIVIFDSKSGDVLGSAKAADDADGIIYDAGSGRVLTACGDAGQLAVLDANADPKSAKSDLVDLGGKPEFIAADGKGMAYVNLEDKSELAVVDIKALKTTQHYKIGNGDSPAGLAIDPKAGTLFIGCHNKLLVVMNAADGKVIAELPIGSGNDAVAFDAGTGEIFASCGDGTTTVVKKSDTGKYEVMQTIATPRGARTLAVDLVTHLLYLPTAEMTPAKPGERRPSPKPNSFMVAVVGPMAAK